MNINDFREYIDETILERGHGYYIVGNVNEDYDYNENEYIFDVEGSEYYKVVVNIDDSGNILYSECDCPYDFGPTCKHEVAVYFKLEEILKKENKSVKQKKKYTKKIEIKELLENLSKEELVNMIIELTQKNKALKESIIFKYSDCDDEEELKKCRKLIKSIVKKYAGRQHFIEYHQTYLFTEEIREVLNKAVDAKNKLLAIEMVVLVLEEAIAAFQYADDSDGEIGQLVSDTISYIEDIGEDTRDNNTKTEIFERLLKLSENKVFDGWDDHRIEILNICTIFAYTKDHRKKLKSKIEDLIDTSSGNYYDKYKNEKLLELQYYLVADDGSEEDVEKFIEDNIDYTVFREISIGRYFDKQDYDKVIELTIEGEEKDRQYKGLVSRWKSIRYSVYKELGLSYEQEKLAKELFIDGDFQYYKELKQLSKSDNFYDELKKEIKVDTPYQSNIFIKLIEEENDLEEMLELISKNISRVEYYAPKLIDKYKDKVIYIYEEYIKYISQASKNRSNYKDVCRKIEGYKKIAEEEKQSEIIDYLKDLYKKRPAFIDELSKIK